MRLRSILFSALFVITSGLPAIAQSERAVLVDYYDGDKRSEGTVVWSTEEVKTSDGRNDLAIRADIDIPGHNLKLTMSLRRNLDPSVPASHLIELTFTVPPGFIDGGMGDVFPMSLEPIEMSAKSDALLGTMYKTTVDGFYMEGLSDKPADICHNLALLSDNLGLYVSFRGAKPRWRSGLPEQRLWFSKGEAAQRAFDAVFAAWEKTPAAGAKSAVCQPS